MGSPGEASSSSDTNSWMKTFQQQNEGEALKIVLDMSKKTHKKKHKTKYLHFRLDLSVLRGFHSKLMTFIVHWPKLSASCFVI